MSISEPQYLESVRKGDTVITANSFTIIDAFNQFWKVWEVADRRSSTCIGLYFYIVKKWNTCGRPNEIRLQNNLICAELEMSKPTMNRVRNQLKQWGLIQFYSRGKGDSNITYQVLEIQKPDNVGSKKSLLLAADLGEKEKNFTSHVTSNVTSGDSLKQSTEKELEIVVVIAGEVKNFYYLKDLFSADAGLKLAWEKRFMPEEEFPDAVEKWMIQNHGKPYENFRQARKHFLFWIPSYTIRGSNVGGRQNEPKFKGKEPQPFWQPLVETWFDFVRKKYGDEPSFQRDEPQILNRIIGNLKKRAESKNVEWNETTAVFRFNAFLEKAYEDKWLAGNFLLANLEKQIDKIILNGNGQGINAGGQRSATARSVKALLSGIDY